MDNIDIFRQAALALERGVDIALVSVTAAVGSTPGKVGYKMLVYAQNPRTVGTVGGGRVEARMVDEASKLLGSPACRLLRFDLDKTPDDEDGICGGRVEFLIETFGPADLPFFQKVLAAADQGDNGSILSIVAPDGLPRKIHLAREDPTAALLGLGLDAASSREIAAAASLMADPALPLRRVSVGAMQVFIEPLAKPPTVILCGAGHVAYHVARCARSVHFRVIVCDERPAYANRERFPDADQVVAEDFSRLFDRVPVDDHCYIVIVTRGHRCDEIVLQQAVRTDARYIGMIGSRQKTSAVLRKLKDKGVPPELLDGVYSPIGLSIGAVTAQEIALSVVCELVKIRRLGDEAPIGHMAFSSQEGVA